MITCPHSCGEYRKDIGILICRPTGVLTSDRAADIVFCRDCLGKSGRSDVNRFHDLTGVIGVSLSFEKMFSVAEEEGRLRTETPPVKACILVPNTLLYGTMRMYQMFMETRGVEVYIDYDLAAIAARLNVDAATLAHK